MEILAISFICSYVWEYLEILNVLKSIFYLFFGSQSDLNKTYLRRNQIRLVNLMLKFLFALSVLILVGGK